MKMKKEMNNTNKENVKIHLIDGTSYTFDVLGLSRFGTYDLRTDTIDFWSDYINNVDYMGYTSNHSDYTVILE